MRKINGNDSSLRARIKAQFKAIEKKSKEETVEKNTLLNKSDVVKVENDPNLLLASDMTNEMFLQTAYQVAGYTGETQGTGDTEATGDNNGSPRTNRSQSVSSKATSYPTMYFDGAYSTLQFISNHNFSIYDNILFPSYEAGVLSYDDVIDVMVNNVINGIRTINNDGTVFSGYWPDQGIYTIEHPAEVHNDATPPVFRISIDDDNNIVISDDAVRCVMAFLNVMKEHNCQNSQALQYMEMFGFTADDSESVVREKMQAFYKKIDSDGDGKASVKDYWLYLAESGYKFQDINNEHDVNHVKAVFGVVPMNQLKAATDAQNYFRKSQEKMVDYGFTIEDVYELGLNEFGDHIPTNENKVFVITSDRLISYMQSISNKSESGKELYNALKKAINAYGSIDKLISAWFKDGKEITPEELLARLTGAHEDSKSNECYVVQKSYEKQAVEMVLGLERTNELFDLRDGRYYLKPGMVLNYWNGTRYIDNLKYINGGYAAGDIIDKITNPNYDELSVEAAEDYYPTGSNDELTMLYALYQTEYGRQCIDNRITFNSDGSVTVRLRDCDTSGRPDSNELNITIPKSMVDSAKKFAGTYTGVYNGGGNLNLVLYFMAYQLLLQEMEQRVYDFIEENGMFSAYTNSLVGMMTVYERYDDGHYMYTGINSQWVQTSVQQGLVPRMQTVILAKRAKAMLDSGMSKDEVYAKLFAEVRAEADQNPVPNWWQGGYADQSDAAIEKMVSAAMDNAINGQNLTWNASLTGTLFWDDIWYNSAPFGSVSRITDWAVGTYSNTSPAYRHDKYDNNNVNALRAYSAMGLEFMATFEMNGEKYIVLNVDDDKISFVSSRGDNGEVQTMSIVDFAKKATKINITILNSEAYDKVKNSLPDYPDDIISGDSFTRELRERYPAIDTKSDEKAMKNQASTMGLEEYYDAYKYVYRDMAANSNGYRKYYIWDSLSKSFVYLGNFKDETYVALTNRYYPLAGDEDKMRSDYRVMSYMLGMQPTQTRGVYVKNDVYYRWDSETKKFVEIKESGFELIEYNEKFYVATHGYNYTNVDGVYTLGEHVYIFVEGSGMQRIGVKTDENVELAKALAEQGLVKSSVDGVYHKRGEYETNTTLYMWNPATRTMSQISVKNVNNLKGTKYYGAVRAQREGYYFTKTDGVYKKYNKFYRYDATSDKFVQVAEDGYPATVSASGVQVRGMNYITGRTIKDAGLKRVYENKGYIAQSDDGSKFYIYNIAESEWVEIPAKTAEGSKGTKAYAYFCAYENDFNFTDIDGIFEKDGYIYTCDYKTGIFRLATDAQVKAAKMGYEDTFTRDSEGNEIFTKNNVKFIYDKASNKFVELQEESYAPLLPDVGDDEPSDDTNVLDSDTGDSDDDANGSGDSNNGKGGSPITRFKKDNGGKIVDNLPGGINNLEGNKNVKLEETVPAEDPKDTSPAEDPIDETPTTPAPASTSSSSGSVQKPVTIDIAKALGLDSAKVNEVMNSSLYGSHEWYIKDTAFLFVFRYFGIDLSYGSEALKGFDNGWMQTFNKLLTDEQKQFVYDNPQIFHLVKEYDNNGTQQDANGKFNLQLDDYCKEYIVWHMTAENGSLPASPYSYNEGEYDMFGLGNPPGPNGSVPTDIPGVYYKQGPMVDGENTIIIYAWDAKAQDYVVVGNPTRTDAIVAQFVINVGGYGPFDLQGTSYSHFANHDYDERYQALKDGFNPTSMTYNNPHGSNTVYEKDGVYYVSNNACTWIPIGAEEITVYQNPCSIKGGSTTGARPVGAAPEGTIPTGVPGIYYQIADRDSEGGHINLYIWDDAAQCYQQDNIWFYGSVDPKELEKALKNGDFSYFNSKDKTTLNFGSTTNEFTKAYFVNFFGLNATNVAGDHFSECVYELNGKYYKYDPDWDYIDNGLQYTSFEGNFNKIFKEWTPVDTTGITVYDSTPPVIETKLSGITETQMPANLTYDEFMQYVILINFLKENIKPNLDYDEYGYRHHCNGWPRSIYDFDRLQQVQGATITPENWEQYKNAITYYDKDELRELVLQVLMENSWAMYAQLTDEQHVEPYIKSLFNALGAKNLNFVTGKTMSPSHLEAAEYTYANFTLDGKSYSIGFPPLHACSLNVENLVTGAQIEEMRNYMSEATYQNFLKLFIPVITVDGKTELYVVGANALAVGVTPQDIIDFYKTHDADACLEHHGVFVTDAQSAGEEHVIDQDEYNKLLLLGLNQEVLDWYLARYVGDNEKHGGTAMQVYYFTFNMDPNIPYPKLYSFEELYNYAKTHDLNAEFAALKATAQNGSGGANAPELDLGGNDPAGDIPSADELEDEKSDESTNSEPTTPAAAPKVQTGGLFGRPAIYDLPITRSINGISDAESDDTVPEDVLVSSKDYSEKRAEMAKKLGLFEIRRGSCIYTDRIAGSKTFYIWEPVNEKFIELPNSKELRNNKLSESVEKTMAILKAQQMKLNFTKNYPYECVDNAGNHYQYDKDNNTFVKK